MASIILGIAAFYHDSAAALIIDGKIVAAAQEERFTRVKHDAAFPVQAIRAVLETAGVAADAVTAVAFYDKPFLKFERLLETYHAFAPRGLRSFLTAMPVWIKEKLFMRRLLRRECKALGLPANVPLYFPEHHLSHAASAFYPSPFKEAAILTIDGVGEWATTTISKGVDGQLQLLREGKFPHSAGLLYSAFTYFLGFKVNSGEYKLMGLAPYGHANSPETKDFVHLIKTTLTDIREDGSLFLNMDYFDFATGLTMVQASKWEQLFGVPLRKVEDPITQQHMNLAMAIQQVTEEIVIALARTARQLTGCKHLVMAGGVALNCVANGKLAALRIFEDTWIQPAAGDAGGALGAALAVHYIAAAQPRDITLPDSMQGAALGPSFTNLQVKSMILQYGATAQCMDDSAARNAYVAQLLARGKIVGWFQGRMEFGPRALGQRSILADPRRAEMQQHLNVQIKAREGFRPFAPAVLAADAALYFNLTLDNPYMLFVSPVQASQRRPEPEGYANWDLQERLHQVRSTLPAVTHIDYSARVQTVDANVHPVFHALLTAFKKETGCPVLVNTSFNVRGEPIVCTPEQAYLAFMRTDMDVLVVENYVFLREEQAPTKPVPAGVFGDD